MREESKKPRTKNQEEKKEATTHDNHTCWVANANDTAGQKDKSQAKEKPSAKPHAILPVRIRIIFTKDQQACRLRGLRGPDRRPKETGLVV